MLEAIADAGLAGLGAMERVVGAGGVTRASDLHRLVDAQLVDADALAAFLASRYGVRLLDGAALEDMEIAASDLSHRFLVDNWLLPLRGADGTRLVGALHPGDHEPLDALFAVLDEHAELCVVSAPDMEARLERLADAPAPEAPSGAEARTSVRLPRARRRNRCDAGMARVVAGMERATVVIDACARESG